MSELRRRFPILDGPSVPWEYMEPHEAMAKKNHGQTLEQLAKRGGLGCAEAEMCATGCHAHGVDWDQQQLKGEWLARAEHVNADYRVLQSQLTEVLEREANLSLQLSAANERADMAEAEREQLRVGNWRLSQGLFDRSPDKNRAMVAGVVDSALNHIDRLTEERDRLRAALAELLDECTDRDGDPLSYEQYAGCRSQISWDAVDKAKAALVELRQRNTL